MSTRKSKSLEPDLRKLADENKELKNKVKELEEKLLELNKQADKLNPQASQSECLKEKVAGNEEIIKDLYNQVNQWRGIVSELRSRKELLEDITERYSAVPEELLS